MGLIKRILKHTSSKLLTKLGVQHSAAQRLVVNQAVPSGLAHGLRAKKVRSTRRPAKKSRANSRTAQEAAVLNALTANLPAVQFHHVHGPNAELSSSKMVARRSQSFCQALVFSNRVIVPNERVYIKVLEISKGWSGTIRFGFTAVDPATLANQVPKHACPDMTNAGNTWARALADEVVRRNSVIHFSYNSDGFIHYGINNQDCGIFYANVNTNQNLWFIVDIYGLTAAVELIDPRMCATGELDTFSADDELAPIDQRTTLAKLESSQRLRKKRPRKVAYGYSANGVPLLGQWAPAASWPLNNQLGLIQRDALPNLSSMELPLTQQNIYSPMPNQPVYYPAPPASIARHDYYHLLAPEGIELAPAAAAAAVADEQPARRASTHERLNNDLNESSSTAATATSTTTTAQDDLSHQMSNMRLQEHQPGREQTVRAQPVRGEASRIPTRSVQYAYTTAPDIERYIAGVERSREQVVYAGHRYAQHFPAAPTTNTTTTSNRERNTLSNKSRGTAKTKSSKTRQASSSAATAGTANNSASTTTTPNNKSRDNNNPPSSRDCPICFERPINCVLYQCGHMCTCYECGVKQWKTQSRTCPICRTVIKDVIKTYMS